MNNYQIKWFIIKKLYYNSIQIIIIIVKQIITNINN